MAGNILQKFGITLLRMSTMTRAKETAAHILDFMKCEAVEESDLLREIPINNGEIVSACLTNVLRSQVILFH